MDVPGRMEGLDLKPTTSDSPLCLPCKLDGIEVSSDGFCKNCSEHLCKTCLEDHMKGRSTKHHVLLDKTQIPEGELATGAPPDDQITELCDKHPHKLVEYFCDTHNSLGCHVCTVKDHRSCSIDYIPDISKEYKASEEYKMLIETFEKLLKTTEEYNHQIDENIETAEGYFTTLLEDMRSFREEIIAYLDKKETEIRSVANQRKKDDIKLMKKLKQDSEKITEDVQMIKSQLHDHETQLNTLFVKGKQSKSQIQQLQKDCSSLHKQNKIGSYQFKPLDKLKKLINTDIKPQEELVFENEDNAPDSDSATVLEAQPQLNILTSKLELKGRINIKSHIETSDINLNDFGMVPLSAETLGVADRNNNSVKIVNTTLQQVTSFLPLCASPFDITQLPKDQIAVTIPRLKRIDIISTCNGLRHVGSINVKDECTGICYFDGKLIVGYGHQNMIDILNMDGDVLRNITFDTNTHNGKSMYILVHGPFIYVSHGFLRFNHTFTTIKVSMDGTIVKKYERSLLLQRGIAIAHDSQILMQCPNGNKSDVLAIRVDGSLVELTQWKSQERDVHTQVENAPIVMSQDMRTMYTGHGDSARYIRVYKLT